MRTWVFKVKKENKIIQPQTKQKTCLYKHLPAGLISAEPKPLCFFLSAVLWMIPENSAI